MRRAQSEESEPKLEEQPDFNAEGEKEVKLRDSCHKLRHLTKHICSCLLEIG